VDAGRSRAGDHGPSWAADTFVPRGDGTYATVGDSDGATLAVATADGDQDYIVTSASGARFEFPCIDCGILAYVDPQGDRATVDYEGQQNPQTITTTAGTTRLIYDTNGRIVRAETPHGDIHRYEYDTDGYLLRHIAPGSQTTEYTYDPDGYLTEVSEPGGRTTRFDYAWALDRRRIQTMTRVTDPSTGAGPTTQLAFSQPAQPPCDVGAYVGSSTIQASDASTATFCWDARAEATNVGAIEPANPNDGSAYGCIADPFGEQTYCGENPPADPDGLGSGVFGPLAASTNISWGISDNNLVGRTGYDMFSDSAFTSLQLQRVRRTVPWNIVAPGTSPQDQGSEYQLVADWLTKAFAAGYKPMLSLERCSGTFVRSGQTLPCESTTPTREEYIAHVRALLEDPTFGRVKEFTAWNEPNLTGYQPTGFIHDPAGSDHQAEDQSATFSNSGAYRAGRYWYEFWKLCQNAPGYFNCTVAAGDFLDSRMGDATDRTSWGARFYTQYFNGALRNRPERWAWHAYRDGERTLIQEDPSRWWAAFRAFAIRTSWVGNSAQSPYLWLTEQGATRIRRGGLTTISQIAGRAATPAEENERAVLVTHRLTRAIDSGLLASSSRILRFFYYHMKGDRNDFDAGLKNPDNTVRPNYDTYRCRTVEGPSSGCTVGTN
jgi:YD repeat-containing protein